MSAKISAKFVLREYVESLLVAISVALILRFFVVSAYKIPTGSMTPTLKAGDFVLVYKLPYGVPVPFVPSQRLGARLPKRGDVVVFRYPQNEAVNYIKRVVGLPGERIEIKQKKLFINEVESTYDVLGTELINDLPGHEYYRVLKEKFHGSTHLVMNREDNEAGFFGPIVVPPGHVFVLGDNRDSSDDSRYWGTVPVKNVDGRVILVWLSLNWLDRWGDDRFPSVRWQRVVQLVQ